MGLIMYLIVSGLDTFEDEKRVAKQILIDKFEELM